jgi:DNA-binding NtrC family response regulator
MRTLLLVDDDRDGLPIRRLIFERAGFEVTTAATVEEARAAFFAHTSEIVLLDLHLPELEDGCALIRDFRNRSPEVRLIVLSGFAGGLHQRPESQMVDLVLEKPLRSEKLLRAVAGV